MSVSPSTAPAAAGPPLRLLALETSTDTLSLALGTGVAGGPLWQHTGPGGAQASATLLPLLHDLLTQAGWTLRSLDALVFGRGPGSFTGLRTACAVAQGLAYGSQDPARPGGIPVLAVDTLLALAEAALSQAAAGADASAGSGVVVALLDARMDELYVAPYAWGPQGLRELAPPRLCAPQQLGAYLAQCLPADAALAQGACLLAGNVFDTYAERLADVPGRRISALPSAAALLRLAPGLLAAGAAVAAQDALPLYVRDKVAQTTAERDALRLASAARTAAPAVA
jgi:tRNA threonylcarbamoyladenosine biosynthesis protein TsaB